MTLSLCNIKAVLHFVAKFTLYYTINENIWQSYSIAMNSEKYYTRKVKTPSISNII